MRREWPCGWSYHRAVTVADTAPAQQSSFERLSQEFSASLSGKSPKTQSTYVSGLRSFAEFLASKGGIQEWAPRSLTATSLEEYYAWLVRRHGRDRLGPARNLSGRRKDRHQGQQSRQHTGC